MSVALPTQLNRCYVEIPKKTEMDQRRKATLYGIISKICLVAFLAITASAIALSLGCILPISTSWTLPFLFSAVPLQFAFQSFMAHSLSANANANIAEQRAMRLEQIGSWSVKEIENFFKEHRLSLKNLPIGLLKKINPKEPLKALLPAIAGYQYFFDQTEFFFKQCVENLNNQVEDPIFKLSGRRKGWHLLEKQVLPAALNAAVCLQVIAQPTLQVNLDEIGVCRIKAFDERIFDQLIEGRDEYFIFKDRRPPLNLKDFEIFPKELRISLHDIDALRAKLF